MKTHTHTERHTLSHLISIKTSLIPHIFCSALTTEMARFGPGGVVCLFPLMLLAFAALMGNLAPCQPSIVLLSVWRNDIYVYVCVFFCLFFSFLSGCIRGWRASGSWPFSWLQQADSTRAKYDAEGGCSLWAGLRAAY